MRTKNSFINLIISWGTQLANVIFQFGIRTIFVIVLSAEYLGVNGLFSNILSFLSFAELGFGAAITFSLYKPIAEDDQIQIAGIMNFFKKVYCCVGCFVLVVGIALTPFISFFIKDIPDIPHISLIYVLWVINSGLSYFLIYKSTLIIAYQRKHIVETVNMIVKVVTIFLQAVVLLTTHNYVFYLILQVVGTVGGNFFVSRVADREYPYLNQYRHVKINKETLAEIKKNVSATIMHKVGAVLIFGTDNILLSKFFGLVVVGVYSNYSLIVSTLTNLVGQIQASVVASVGNLGVTASDEKKREVFEQYLFMIFWIFSFSATCLIALLNPFIEIWVGKDYLLPISVVSVVVFNYFLTGLRSAAATFDNALGLFWNTRKLPVVESILNLGLSIVLANYIGYIGIFLGTAISSLLSGAWFEPYILYKYGFKESPYRYYRLLVEYLFVALFNGAIITIIVNSIHINGFLGFIFRCMITGIGSNLVLFVIYYRNEKMKYIYDVLYKVYEIVKYKFNRG